jgi:acetolactate synthase-1/2/3 large subunit
LLAITGQTALAHQGKHALQGSDDTAVDLVHMFQTCTLYSTMVSHPHQLERKLATALNTALGTPGGPVHLSMPTDVLRLDCASQRPSFDFERLIADRAHRQTLVDADAVNELCARLSGDDKYVFVLGDDVGPAISLVLEVAFLLNATIVTTPQGKGQISPYHPLYRGVIGFAGHDSARTVVEDPDVRYVVSIGTDHSEMAASDWVQHPPVSRRLIHIEAREERLATSPMALLRVRGPIKTVFSDLLQYLRTARSGRLSFDQSSFRHFENQKTLDKVPKLHFALDDEKAYRSPASPIKPQRLMWDLPNLLPPDTVYLADSGNSFAWAVHYLHPFDRRMGGGSIPRVQRAGMFRARFEWAPMGWAVGAALGVAIARQGRPVVTITGDGAYLMSGQEFTVAVQERLTVIFVVLNDAALGMVKHGQRLGGSEEVGYTMPPVRLDAMARAMGGEDAGYAIHSPLELRQLDWEKIARKPGPTLLDIRIDPEEIPPISSRIKVITTSAD